MKRYYLDLSGDDLTRYSAVNPTTVIPFNASNFPAGEVYFNLDTDTMPDLTDSTVVIILNSGKSDDIMRLLMANDAIRRYDVKSVELFMPYVPYGRQDRVVRAGDSLSVKVFADLINSLHFDKVIITDPHSYVTPAVLNNCVIDTYGLDAFILITMTYRLLDMTPVTIVAPDAGAEKRCSRVANKFNQKLATATKHRTPEGITIKMNTNDISERVVIIDDICDGGRTFIELAKVLKGEYGVKHVTLIVTHGIFSAGMRVFDGLIDEIRCYNDISKDTRSLMNVVKNSTKLFGR